MSDDGSLISGVTVGKSGIRVGRVELELCRDLAS